ncbi:MAG TPA: right-handed parallel beta-helix repeat-containing protein [Streptosporangiaceae bacterium]
MAGIGALIIAVGSGATLAACGTSARPAAAALPAQHPAGPAKPAAHAAPASAAPAKRAHPRRHQALPRRMPAAGNPAGHAPLPSAARPADTSHPTRVIGHGTPASCTSKAVVAAVRAGGVIKFSCGPKPVTIVMRATAKVRNTSAQVVLDGGGKVTLSGGGKRRILYQDTCDKRQVWTTSHCQNQASPRLTVQNITFKDGNSTGAHFDGGGGGAIFDRGGQLKVINATFLGNRCDRTGPDLGGAAIRALSQYRNRPVYVSRSTFRGGVCSNGGALSSIGVSWVVLNSVMTNNRAIGRGANPARPGTPGGGSGGAIYTDGDKYTVKVTGTLIHDNHANEGGGAIFFVSNDRTGTLTIKNSKLHHNPNAGFHTAGFPGIFFLGKGSHPVVINSTIN